MRVGQGHSVFFASASELTEKSAPIRRGLQYGIELLLKVLEVGHVAGNTNDGLASERVQSLNILESGEGSIRGWRQTDSSSIRSHKPTKVVCGDHDTLVVLDAEDARSRHQGLSSSELHTTFSSLTH